MTDTVDVGCVTYINIQNQHVNSLISEKHSLDEAVIKFLIKFSSGVRKLEFRFILEVPQNLRSVIIEKYHFTQGEEKDSSSSDEIMIRKKIILPSIDKIPQGIVIRQEINGKYLTDLLELLKKNAYWQKELTIERLELLVKHSECFFVFRNEKMIGFARVLTDHDLFASLWDVVVDESCQHQGIGMTLMHCVFSHEKLKSIPHWMLFTGSAKKLYEKFGFVSENAVPERKLVYKLRMQDIPPSYMLDLIKVTQEDFPVQLNEKESLAFLFNIKRANLTQFWREIKKMRQREG